eukprot:3648581-Pleurochrysis_carterae.AAC.1
MTRGHAAEAADVQDRKTRRSAADKAWRRTLKEEWTEYVRLSKLEHERAKKARKDAVARKLDEHAQVLRARAEARPANNRLPACICDHTLPPDRTACVCAG